MLTMASNIRSTLSSWFNCRKRTATEVETPQEDIENTSPNIPGSPHPKKHRSSTQYYTKPIYNAKRKLDMSLASSRKFKKRSSAEERRATTTQRDWLTNIATDSEHGMGWFMTLPIELFQMILNLLDNDALLLMSSLSKDLNSSILNYLLSGQGLKHILPYKSHLSISRNVSLFIEAGKLFRKITATQSLSRRLRIASQFSTKLKIVHEHIHVDSGSAMAYKCFGRLFSQYIVDWSEYEKLRAYCIIERQSKLDQKVEHILRFCSGVLPWQEYDYRQLIRNYLLEPSTSDKEYSFWLAQLLKGHPITHQARLLYILTGPTDNAGFIYWSGTCNCTSLSHSKVPTGIGNRERNLSETARALRALLLNRKEWTMDSIISIFDELTTIPSGWCLGQVATLLMEAGTEVCQAIFGNRAVNGHVNELSVMAYYLAHACVKDDNEKGKSQKLCWYIELIKYSMAMLPNKTEKQWFAKQLINHWQTYLTSLFEEEDFEDESEFEDIHQEFTISLNCLIQLSVLLINNVAT